MEEVLRGAYVELIKRCVLGLIYRDAPMAKFDMLDLMKTVRTGAPLPYSYETREKGRDWPSQAHSMIGLRRLTHLEQCIQHVLADGVPGDFIETGVWRGGSCILMRAMLKAHGVTDRTVWVADSFQGLPPSTHPKDQTIHFDNLPPLEVPLEEVQQNFAAYGLLDDQVKFLKGWFRDTLPLAPVGQLAILRLDGDLYESTMDALTSLYAKLAPGGFLIVDDYNLVPCRDAVHDFRQRHGIDEAIVDIDGAGAFWRRRFEARA